MPIMVQCSGCGGKFRAPDEAAGKRVKCPKCSAMIEVGTIFPTDTCEKIDNSLGVLVWAWVGGGVITLLLVIGLAGLFMSHRPPPEISPTVVTTATNSATPPLDNKHSRGNSTQQPVPRHTEATSDKNDEPQAHTEKDSTAVSLPKIRTAFESSTGDMGTLLQMYDTSGTTLFTVLATTDSGKPILTVCADMKNLTVYRLPYSPKDHPVGELKLIKCDVELKLDGKTLSGSLEGKVTIIDSGLSDNVRTDCRTVAAQALGAGNCLDLRGRFDGFYLIIFDDSGAVVRTHCLVCSNPGSRLQSDFYRIVPATLTVKGAVASQNLPSEVIYVQPRPTY